MKNFKLLLISCLVLSSCSLEREPEDFISTPNYFNTEEDVYNAVVGVYNVLGERFLFSGAGRSLVTNFDAGEEFYLTNRNETRGTAIYNYSTTDPDHDNIWARFYKGIERANIVLANIDKPEMDENLRTVYKGEVKFLRAYLHFLAVQNFGDVPLRTAPTASVEDVFNVRVPADEVYQFVYDEMVEAEQMVPEITEYDHAGRITKSAVQGILARVSLYMAGEPNNISGKYEDALFWAEKVINSGYHELNPDYSQVFINLIQNQYDTKEIIWEVEFFTTGAGEIYNNRGYLGVDNGILNRNPEYGISNPQWRIQEYFYDRFNSADVRRDWSIAAYEYTNNRAPEKHYWNENQIYNRYIGKYRREFEQLSNKGNWTGTNFPLLRYSDVLLMAAEAENEINGPTPKAINYAMKVRERAFAGGKSVKNIQVTEGGNGYVEDSTFTIAFEGGSPSYLAGLDSLDVEPIISNGVLTDLHITSRGTLFETPPTVFISSDSGSGAQAEVELASESDIALDEAANSKESFREFIQNERSRELAFEGLRRLDLIRWGILVSQLQEVARYAEETAPDDFQHAAKAGNNVEVKHILMPIPNWEFSTNPNTTQNPGW